MKKKGLIISTVVMAVVLIASLTTATYAWFSATATAEVKNIAISTQAAEGLQVAVKSGTGDTDYVSGSVTYDGTQATKWAGDTGFGSLVDFSSITGSGKVLGTWSDAVTVIGANGIVSGDSVAADVYAELTPTQLSASPYSYINGSTTFDGSENLYTNDTTNYAMKKVVEEEVYSSSTQYYKKLEYATEAGADKFVTGDYVVPIGYNSSTGKPIPYGYLIAKENVKYLSLPISVKATKDVGAIYCSITVTPDQGTMASYDTYKPGMAAAARLLVTDETGNKFTFVPYENVNMTTVKGTDASFVFNFVLAYANGSTSGAENKVAGGVPHDYNFTIWIEGTDTMCNNTTNGSGFGVDIAFNYSSTQPTFNAAEATIINNGLTDSTDQMVGIATTGTIEFEGKTYYVGAWTDATTGA